MTFKEYIESKFQVFATASIGSSTGIKIANVDSREFIKHYDVVEGSTYTFTYDATATKWKYSNNEVNVNVLGIYYDGLPNNNDTIIITGIKPLDYKVYEEQRPSGILDDKYIIISTTGGDNVFSSGQNINYTLTIRTNDPLTTLMDLKNFAIENSGTYYQEDSEWANKVLINMPYKSQAFQEGNINYHTEFILPVFTTAIKNLNEINYLLIDGEKIIVDSATLTYATQVDNQRKNDNELNQTNVTFGNLQLSFTAINYDNIFNRKVTNIMFGDKEKDTAFTIVVIYINGTTKQKTMKLTSVTQPKDRATLPITSYVFMV